MTLFLVKPEVLVTDSESRLVGHVGEDNSMWGYTWRRIFSKLDPCPESYVELIVYKLLVWSYGWAETTSFKNLYTHRELTFTNYVGKGYDVNVLFQQLP